jgi:hypothetical protein
MSPLAFSFTPLETSENYNRRIARKYLVQFSLTSHFFIGFQLASKIFS